MVAKKKNLTSPKKRTKSSKEKDSPQFSVRGFLDELGIAREGIISTYDNEENPDELGPQTYIDMQRNDGEVQGIVRLLTLPIISTPIHILPAPNDKGERDFIDAVLNAPPSMGGMTTPLPFVIADMTRAVFEGFRLYEKVARIIEEGEYKGMIGWRKLAPRDAQTIVLKPDETGGFAGAHQQAMLGGKMIEVDIPAEKCLLFTFQKEKHWLYGESILRTAYYHYDKKHKLYYIAHKKAEIDTLGLKIIKMDSTKSQVERTAAEDAVDRIGLNTRITLPPGIELEIERNSGGYDPLPLILHHNCVDEETELLSKRGWLKWNELKEDEEIFTLNKETGKSEWKNVRGIFHYFVKDEELISIKRKNGSFSALTTKDHKWLVSIPWPNNKYHWRTSGELKTYYKIPRAVKNSELPLEKTYSDEVVELVAWIMTEGHYHKSGEILIKQNVGIESDRIKSLLEKTDLKWSEWKHQQNKNNENYHVTFNIHSNSTQLLKEIAPNRTPTPEFLTKLTENQLKLFIETSIDGDGSRSKDGIIIFSQKSLERIKVLEMACALVGQPTSSYLRNNHGNDLWQITLLKIPYSQIRRTETKIQKYTGIIWCPNTENGTFLAKREGSIYWTGNSMMAKSALAQAVSNEQYAYPYGKGTPSAQYLVLSIESIMKQMEATLNTYAIAPLIDWNFSSNSYPTLKFDNIADATKVFLMTAFNGIMKSGAILPDGFVSEIVAETAKALKLQWIPEKVIIKKEDNTKKNSNALNAFEKGKLKKANDLDIDAPPTPKTMKEKLLQAKDDPNLINKFYKLGEDFADMYGRKP